MVTVIIPAYNCESTIVRCVTSVINQTYKDLEVIVVNDGSVDNTGNIVSNLCVKDSRINLITQPNGGVSTARNCGIAAAKGEFITFVDSDDYIQPTFVEELMAMYAPGLLPVVNFSDGVSSKGILPIADEEMITIDLGSIDEDYLTGIIGRKIGFCIWNKLFSRDVLVKENIWFDKNIQIGEDMIFMFRYLCHCESISVNSAPLYNYVVNTDSATKKGDANLAFKYEKTWDALSKIEESNVKIKEAVVSAWSLDIMPYILLNKDITAMNLKQFRCFFQKMGELKISESVKQASSPKGIKKKLVQNAIKGQKWFLLFIIIKLYSFYKKIV